MKNNVLILLTILCNLRIANPEQLSGKSLEKKAAELIEQRPQSGTTDWGMSKKDVIQLKFSKTVFIDDKKISITPKIIQTSPKKNKIFTCTKKGKVIKLKFEAPLNEDTTYIVNFNDAIKDEHDNHIKGITISFSTGDEISNCVVKGSVRDLMNNQPIKSGVVNLYQYGRKVKLVDVEKQANILNCLDPEYSTQIDGRGGYVIKNISPGKYILTASDNIDSSTLCDPGKNKYGFIHYPINVNGEHVEDLFITNADIFDFKVSECKSEDRMFNVIFNKPVIKIQCSTKIESKRIKEALRKACVSDDKKKLTLDNSKLQLLPNIDILPVDIVAYDEYNNRLEQTINVSFSNKSVEEKNKKQKDNLTIECLNKNRIISEYPSFNVSNTKTISSIDKKFFKLIVNGEYAINTSDDDIVLDTQTNTISIKLKNNVKNIIDNLKKSGKSIDAKQDITVSLIIIKDAIVYEDEEKNEEKTLTTKFTSKCGDISGLINSNNKHFTVQLLDKEYKVIEEIYDVKNFNFRNVASGKYHVRCLSWPLKQDKWHYGNIYELTPNDNVTHYDKEINIINGEQYKDVIINLN